MTAIRRSSALCVAAFVLGACVAVRPPAEEIALAQAEIDAGSTESGVRRMERAFEALPVSDAARWDRLGDIAAQADPGVSRRAFDRAEALLWPDAVPRTNVRLTLPFNGRWIVTQGNRGEFSHRRLADRFSWDFQRLDDGGASAARDGLPGLGAPVLAPADGVVERAQDGVPDNIDGCRNYVRAAGNVVVIRHGPSEMTHFCHLQCGSVTVRVGDTVRRGDMIGRCGCSGNAIEPHLHFALRAGRTSSDVSIPARFEGARIIRRDPSAPAIDGVPQQGDVVEAAR